MPLPAPGLGETLSLADVPGCSASSSCCSFGQISCAASDLPWHLPVSCCQGALITPSGALPFPLGFMYPSPCRSLLGLTKHGFPQR